MFQSNWSLIFALAFFHCLNLSEAKFCSEILEKIGQNVITLKKVDTFQSVTQNGFLEKVSNSKIVKNASVKMVCWNFQIRNSGFSVNCIELSWEENKVLCHFKGSKLSKHSKINSIFYKGLLICSNESGKVEFFYSKISTQSN